MKKYVKLTKKILVTNAETDYQLKAIWEAAYREVKINHGNSNYKLRSSSNTIRKDSIDFRASTGAAHITGIRHNFRQYFSDCTKTILIKLEESPTQYLAIEVITYDGNNPNSFEIALALDSIEYQLLEVIGNKLLLCEEKSAINSFLKSFFVELTDQILFKEYRIEE